MTLWGAWVERMLPPGLDEEAGIRSRFFVSIWGIGIPVTFVLAVLYALASFWSQLALCAWLLSCGPLLLWLHRRGATYEPLAHITLAACALTFGLSTLAQHPVDFTSLAELLLIPLMASFMLRREAARPWLFITLIWAALVSLAADSGWSLDFVDPEPRVTHVVNMTIGLVLTWLFARTFDDARSHAMERLRTLDRARSAFLANISHEIRTPMNGVLGMTEVMLLEELSVTQREQLSTIHRCGRTLVSLINDLLDLSKMEAGKLVVEQADFNLDTVLGDVQTLTSFAAANKGLVLKVHKGEGVPGRLRGDGLRLAQVLTNLMSNAVKFTTEGQVLLEVGLLPSDGSIWCSFAISDTGVGIAPEVLPRLFNAFQQGDSSTTRRYGGTGLGLALSQQLVNLMGGHIEVSSEPGGGSRFSFNVAFVEADEPSGEHHLEALPGDPQQSVLVVDDNAINLKVAMSLVEKAGFRAVGATNGKEALAAVQGGVYALVLMDCHMPEMDGFEATERIRSLLGEKSRTPIVALTASAMPDELAACRRAGMSSVLAKPLSFAALREVLRLQVVGP